MYAPIPLHKNDGMNSIAFVATLVASLATIIYLVHQTKLLHLQISKHDTEMRLMLLQIKKHEEELNQAPEQENATGKQEAQMVRLPWG